MDPEIRETELRPDEAKNLMEDPLFQKLVKEMNHIIDSEMNKMVFAKDEHEMVRCQERVQALRFVQRLPEIIVDREEVEEPGSIIKP